MSRDALIVGISHYQYLNDLGAAAHDAEAVAHCLHKHSDFKIKRLPEAIADGNPKVATSAAVSVADLEKELENLFLPDGKEAPETALFYFSGHGMRIGSRLKRGYLATSDTNPQANNRGLSLQWLRDLLQESPVRQQLVWLDCCNSGEFFDCSAANPRDTIGKRRCFITASRSFEAAYEDLQNPLQSSFTRTLLAGLDPNRAPDGKVTSASLVAHIERKMPRDAIQSPTANKTGEGDILITWTNDPQGQVEALREHRHVPRQEEKLPSNYVPRPVAFSAVKMMLMQEASAEASTLVVSAIYGLGGIGKSVLASALAADTDIKERFPDGTLWITLGHNPDLLPMLGSWIRALGDYNYQPLTPGEASSHLRTLLYDRQMLLVVDDVWHAHHLEPFRVGGQGSCVLVTTRGTPIGGAQKYDLDVMTEEQAMELLTKQQATPLSPEDKQQAAVFASRVGYLPLALELSSAQIEEGFTWRELLSDYDAEVERLEILDRGEKSPSLSDENRRKDSLTACFNLSLKSLTPEQQQYFAWLGVLPEDADLSRRMAKTLWQLSERQAGNVLKAFRIRGLLKGEHPAYRIHDLMHDLAVQLLERPSEPQDTDSPAGLGLDRPTAHRQLLEQYQQQTQDRGWHTLKDDGYIHNTLTWHMQQAQQPEQIHQLLQETNDSGRNGWYTTCDQMGKLALFASDLARAWQLSRDDDRPLAQILPQQLRYACIRASLNSLADNIPASMVSGLLKAKIWQPAQALAYAQQTYEPWQRAKYLIALSPYVSKALLPEIFSVIETIHLVAYRSRVLATLSLKFTSLWPKTIVSINEIQDIVGRQNRWREHGFTCQSVALTEISTHIPAQYLPEILKIAREIQSDADRTVALIALLDRLPELFEEVLEMARVLQDKYYRALALTRLSNHSKKLVKEALTAIEEVSEEYDKVCLLRDLAAYLPEELLEKALAVIQDIEIEEHRSIALCGLSNYLSKSLWEKALSIARGIKDKHFQVKALSSLSQHMPNLSKESLMLIRRIESENERAWALMELLENSPEKSLGDALDITRGIRDSYRRARLLSQLSKHMPELHQEALVVIRKIQHSFLRSVALDSVSKNLPESLWEKALLSTRDIQDELDLVRGLTLLLRSLPELLPDTLILVQGLQDNYSRACGLGALSEHQIELAEETLMLIREIYPEYMRSWVLNSVAPYMPENLHIEALRIVQEIQSESTQREALSILSKHLPDILLEEAIRIAWAIQDDYERAYALGSLSEHRPELYQEVIMITKGLKKEYQQVRILKILVKHLPDILLEEALRIAWAIQDDYERACALGSLSVRQPDLYGEVVTIIKEIQDSQSLCTLLEFTLNEHIPEKLWEEILATALEVQIESERAWALQSIVKYVSVKLLPKVQIIINNFPHSKYQADILSSLLPRLAKEGMLLADVSNAITTLANRSRQQLIYDFVNLYDHIISLTSKKTYIDSLKVMREVYEQWP